MQDLRLSRRSPRRLGFTLIELIVSVAIIAILAAVVVSYVRTGQARTEYQQCVSNITLVNQAMERYKSNAGFYATNINDILSEAYGLPTLPLCPSDKDGVGPDYGLKVPYAGQDGYQYIIYCTDNHHSGYSGGAGYPQYDSTTGKFNP